MPGTDPSGPQHLSEVPDAGVVDVDIDPPTPEESKGERSMGIVRLVVGLIACVNAICQMAGWQELAITPEMVATLASAAFLIIQEIWNWWKNNNMTKAAQTGQKLTDALKRGE